MELEFIRSPVAFSVDIGFKLTLAKMDLGDMGMVTGVCGAGLGAVGGGRYFGVLFGTDPAAGNGGDCLATDGGGRYGGSVQNTKVRISLYSGTSKEHHRDQPLCR